MPLLEHTKSAHVIAVPVLKVCIETSKNDESTRKEPLNTPTHKGGQKMAEGRKQNIPGPVRGPASAPGAIPGGTGLRLCCTQTFFHVCYLCLGTEYQKSHEICPSVVSLGMRRCGKSYSLRKWRQRRSGSVRHANLCGRCRRGGAKKMHAACVKFTTPQGPWLVPACSV